jgi:hypothetical protein
MSQFKRARVIMLPHNNINTTITKYLGSNLLSLNNDILASHTNQHLHVISDDIIKEGDWYLEPGVDLRPTKCEKLSELTKEDRKIIATTDKSLQFHTDYHGEVTIDETKKCYGYSLPQPSLQFIKKYIEFYNRGEIITDVLVEYEIDTIKSACTCNDNSSGCDSSYYDGEDFCCRKRFPNGEYWDKTFKPKINSKDNAITIKKLKDSWNREEICKILEDFGNQATNKQCYLNHKPSEFVADKIEIDKFIKENL